MTDNRVRLHIYERFVEERRPPTVEETAFALGLATKESAEAYRRLEGAHVIVLAPGTLNVWMANPLSAVPTSFRVSIPVGSAAEELFAELGLEGDFWRLRALA